MNGSIATRYARALFLEAQAQFVDKIVYDHLGMLYSSMKAAPDLQFALANPRVDKDTKYKLLVTASGINSGAWAKEGTAPVVQSYDHTLYTRFLQLVLEHHREQHLRMMILVYSDLYREHYKIDKIVFETAVPASPENIEKVKERVSAKTGREVECVTHVRPELIGGFRLRIGDIRYDYSYATKLENIKKRFLCQNK